MLGNRKINTLCICKSLTILCHALFSTPIFEMNPFFASMWCDVAVTQPCPQELSLSLSLETSSTVIKSAFLVKKFYFKQLCHKWHILKSLSNYNPSPSSTFEAIHVSFDFIVTSRVFFFLGKLLFINFFIAVVGKTGTPRNTSNKWNKCRPTNIFLSKYIFWKKWLICVSFN